MLRVMRSREWKMMMFKMMILRRGKRKIMMEEDRSQDRDPHFV